MIRQDAPSGRAASEEEVQLGKSVKKKKPALQAFRTDASAEPRYDVFLSFRGKDTRKYFTDDLYHTLVQQGISTFRDDDDDELERRNSLGPHIVKAIEESRLIIVILSTNYASSTRCLDLLVKAFDSQKVMPKKQVRPIFYDVEPKQVRRQTGNFGEAFSRHTNAFTGNTETVQKWTDALTNLADISGWDLRHG